MVLRRLVELAYAHIQRVGEHDRWNAEDRYSVRAHGNNTTHAVKESKCAVAYSMTMSALLSTGTSARCTTRRSQLLHQRQRPCPARLHAQLQRLHGLENAEPPHEGTRKRAARKSWIGSRCSPTRRGESRSTRMRATASSRGTPSRRTDREDKEELGPPRADAAKGGTSNEVEGARQMQP